MCVKGQDESLRAVEQFYLIQTYFYISRMKLRMVLQNDVTLKPTRFVKPLVKIIFDLLTQRYCGHVDIHINTPLSDIFHCILYS